MELSVIIPTHNQAERLRLVLCSLRRQTLAARHFEVLVVDDGSTDDTAAVAAAMEMANLRVLSLWPNQGRNRARNRGAAEARGELLVFLDGDALPAPDLLQCYLEASRRHGPRAVFCGFQRCLPDLEYLQDPQTGAVVGDEVPSVLYDYLSVQSEALRITEEMVAAGFAAIHARSCEGGYPFPESKRRQDQVFTLLARQPESAVGWLGFIPHNGAVPRALFAASGGFDEQIPFSEGWELAYRLQHGYGAHIQPLAGAVSYHLYHYHPFEDPQEAGKEAQRRYDAIEYMVAKHGDERIRLLYCWFASLWPDPFVPAEAVVEDLQHFDRLYRQLSASQWQEYQIVFQYHPAQLLSQLPTEEVIHVN
ncbi:MAG: glycosyltransferase [Candidatus Latescibacteria bacterium]|nr:glycosyltransferase [Candidatus Latescibacterota bacterium]